MVVTVRSASRSGNQLKVCFNSKKQMTSHFAVLWKFFFIRKTCHLQVFSMHLLFKVNKFFYLDYIIMTAKAYPSSLERCHQRHHHTELSPGLLANIALPENNKLWKSACNFAQTIGNTYAPDII
jgi:hypothetical protein